MIEKTHANWRQITYLHVSCPWCSNTMQIEDEFEVEDWMEELDEECLKDLEITCRNCNKVFGLNKTLKE